MDNTLPAIPDISWLIDNIDNIVTEYSAIEYSPTKHLYDTKIYTANVCIPLNKKLHHCVFNVFLACLD